MAKQTMKKLIEYPNTIHTKLKNPLRRTVGLLWER